MGSAGKFIFMWHGLGENLFSCKHGKPYFKSYKAIVLQYTKIFFFKPTEGCVLLYLRSPKGGCCSISDDLSCCFALYRVSPPLQRRSPAPKHLQLQCCASSAMYIIRPNKKICSFPVTQPTLIL